MTNDRIRIRSFPRCLASASGLARLYALWLAALLMVLHGAPAAALTLNSQDGISASVSMAGSLSIMHDPSRALNIDDIAAPGRQAAFRPLSGNIAEGYTNDAIWLRFSLARRADTPPAWLLEVDPPYLDDITLYSPDARGGYSAIRIGDLFPYSERPVPHHSLVFPLNADTHEATYFLRVETTSSIALLQLRLWQPQGLDALTDLDHLGMGIVLGAICIVFFFNLLFSAWLRDEIYLYYAFTIAALAVLQIFNNGHASPWFFPQQPRLAEYGFGATVCLHNALMALFIGKLFQFHRHWVPAWRLLQGVAAFNGVGVVMALTGNYPVIAGWVNASATLAMIFCIGFVCLLLIRGHDQYIVPALAFSVLSFGVVIRMLRIMNILDLGLGDMTIVVYQVGTVLHLVLLNAALALRTRETENNYRMEKQRALTAAAASERLLEEKVTQRTSSLLHINRELEDEVAQRIALQGQLLTSLAEEQKTIARQRQFVSMVSHEFRNPLALIDAATHALEISRAGHDSFVRQRIQRIQKGVRRLVVLMENYLIEDSLFLGSLTLHPQTLTLQAIVQSAVNTAGLSADGRIVLEQPQQAIPVYADRFLLELALSNLLRNALKCSPPSGLVHVKVRCSGSQGEIDVRDEGPGIPAEAQTRIFEKYYRFDTASSASGAELGLYLAHQIALRHGGNIVLACSNAQGSTLRLLIPLGHGNQTSCGPPLPT